MKKTLKNNESNKNWILDDNVRTWRTEAMNNSELSKLNEIGEKYERIPHPTVKNTFILKEKK